LKKEYPNLPQKADQKSTTVKTKIATKRAGQKKRA